MQNNLFFLSKSCYENNYMAIDQNKINSILATSDNYKFQYCSSYPKVYCDWLTWSERLRGFQSNHMVSRVSRGTFVPRGRLVMSPHTCRSFILARVESALGIYTYRILLSFKFFGCGENPVLFYSSFSLHPRILFC